MKNVLNYQSSEYDCGPTALTNAIRYLFERRDIHPELLRAIALYTLDTYNREGESGKSGTSRMAMQFLANWLNQYGACKHFPISATFLEQERTVISPHSEIVGCLQQRGTVVVRCWLGGDAHYILLTGLWDEGIGVFDPYALPKDSPLAKKLEEEGVRLIEDRPFEMNRLVKMKAFNATDKSNYGMGEMKLREAMLLFNTNTRQTEERTIEYMI